MAYNEVEAGDFKKGFFFPLVQLKDGQATIIAPKEYATGKFETPPQL
jgi:branched-chain amino acid transport system substrate-binding protein